MTHNRTKRLIALITLAVFASAALGMSLNGAGGYDLSWFTIDGGGGTSADGTFALNGTIGQHDAGGPMTGGTFSLAGGFWAGGGGGPTREISALTDLTMLDGVVISGGIPQMMTSDNQVFETEARVTGEAHQTHLLRFLLGADNDHASPQTIEITLESRISDVEGLTSLFLRDWNNNQMVQVDDFVVGITESVHETVVPNAARFVRASDGRIELEFKQIVLIPFTLNGFHTLIDLLEIAVE